ncbi:Isochorismatase hydrolase [Saccharata proteae CBS 121410]|uniref:Isochorismatase hydrolase n=1 Tax=Saccharata proteae CBS 121410 TaxID=1314787 RepID=A0A9P4LZ22_9PEZI|nr:Isochorismatase hydrolase [Saccharata proteae CBS 121410]
MTTLLPHYGLLLIDIQQAFNHPTFWGPGTRSTPAFEANVESLLATFRDVVSPADIFHVCHHSTLPNSPLNPLWDSGNSSSNSSNSGVAFMPCAAPLVSEPTFTKSVNSAFIGTNLEAAIRGRGITVLVVAGLTTDHCVSTTVRMAANLGIVGTGAGQKIMLVSDATATWARGLGDLVFDAETVHAVQLASLGGEFCEVMTTAQVLMELTVDNWRNDKIHR